MKTKFVLVRLKIQNGEYQFNSKSVHEIPAQENVDAFGADYAKDFYSSFSHSEGDVHFFNCGEVAVRDEGTTEITKEEYKILQKYL